MDMDIDIDIDCVEHLELPEIEPLQDEEIDIIVTILLQKTPLVI